MERVFLDANVLFSAAYLPASGLNTLWKIADLELWTSGFAIAEARRNLEIKRPGAIAQFEGLLASVRVTDQSIDLPDEIELVEKDRPILGAAIASGCAVLLTGDKLHFGHLLGKKVQGMVILTPGQFLAMQ